MPISVFAEFNKDAYPHIFSGELHVNCLVGGIPSDPKVIEGWLRTKFATNDEIIRAQVTETILDRAADGDTPADPVEDAIKATAATRNLNGFKRAQGGNHDGQLYIEGRQLKAAIKEAGSVAVAAGKLPSRGWGSTSKGIRSFLAEHVFVIEERLYLYRDGEPVLEPSGVAQRFVHTHRGNSIQYEEYAENVALAFTVRTDQALTAKQWALLWLTGEQQGVGATRSQGFGTYTVTKWDAITGRARTKATV